MSFGMYMNGYRVQIPAWTDLWMQGDRFGEIDGRAGKPRRSTRAKILGNRVNDDTTWVWVRMDKSGRRVRFNLDDLTIQ